MDLDGDPPSKLARIEQSSAYQQALPVHRDSIEFVSEYSDDVFVYWLTRERKHIRCHYLEEGISEMNQTHRYIAVKALFQIHKNMHMSDFDSAAEVLSLAIKLQDLYYMANPDADIKSMFLVSLASHSLADKAAGLYYHINPLEYYELFCDRRYDCKKIYEMEFEILKAINYESILVNGSEIMRRAHAHLYMSSRTKILARYILESSHLFYEFIVEPESRITAAAQYIANKYAKLQWNDAMQHYFGYGEKEIVALAFKLNYRLVDWAPPREIVSRFGGEEQTFVRQHKFRMWNIKKTKKDVQES